MPLKAHGERKYRTSPLLADAVEWDSLRVEHRHIGPGRQDCVTPECTELVYILSGQAVVTRTGDGKTQQGIARAGTSWLVPAGTHETLLDLDGSTECLLIFLPEKLIETSALADYGINPEKTQLVYAGGFADPMLAQLCTALHGLMTRKREPTDDLLAEGLRTALAAHLLGRYNVDFWQPSERTTSLDPKRLRRVLEFIDAHLGEDLSLKQLSSEACLSPFHFARLFREATGRPPHRYLIERRIEMAQRLLSAGDASITEIALDTGFGSQSSLTRAFRKIAGVTPRQFREVTPL